ncbi:MAG: hypothetical protein JO366_06435 [Methylobacteriaceae bacterium]|nr:hypothetical protein [Methylobacteriaceae bacterium]MBV9244433.1 hypothetical protein [Methylobacteriaceae bacterium]
MRTFVYGLILLAAALGYRVATSPEWQQAIGEGSTAVIKPLVVPLVRLINVPAFVYTVSVIILLAGLIACAAYWLRAVQPRLRQLKTVRRGIADLPLPNIRDAKARWPEAMHRLGALLLGNETFVSAWSEFQTQSLKSRGVPNVPFSHFVASEPRGAKEHGGLMQALPGYFTSVGLIFTFVGLVVALYFAAKGFRSGNIEEARASIIQLLNAASFKFLTSVAALISALMVSLFLRFNLSIIERETLVTVELIETFLSPWREEVGSGSGQEWPTGGELQQRLDALLGGMQDLARVLDRLSHRLDARLEHFDDASR